MLYFVLHLNLIPEILWLCRHCICRYMHVLQMRFLYNPFCLIDIDFVEQHLPNVHSTIETCNYDCSTRSCRHFTLIPTLYVIFFSYTTCYVTFKPHKQGLMLNDWARVRFVDMSLHYKCDSFTLNIASVFYIKVICPCTTNIIRRQTISCRHFTFISMIQVIFFG